MGWAPCTVLSFTVVIRFVLLIATIVPHFPSMIISIISIEEETDDLHRQCQEEGGLKVAIRPPWSQGALICQGNLLNFEPKKPRSPAHNRRVPNTLSYLDGGGGGGGCRNLYEK
jgi:hypothetical protein